MYTIRYTVIRTNQVCATCKKELPKGSNVCANDHYPSGRLLNFWYG